MRAVKAGIAPQLVRDQVKNTASWIWEDTRLTFLAEALDGVDNAARAQTAGDGAPHYLRHLLAAHFATVATFVPTDVDTRIRHHAWMTIESHDGLAAACAVVDEVASWDARAVSARTVDCAADDPSCGSVSGHDGEWLSVRAGALGRALVLGAKDIADRLIEAIDRELAREEHVLTEALAAKGSSRRLLAASNVVAHNLGDLSRVVEAWPGKDAVADVRAKYVRLGHPDGTASRRVFVTAGTLNKALLALENHRFLALRKPRGLRTSRDLLLPIGPWFDGWGETVARHPGLEDRDRAEIVAALLETHLSSPDALGCLRALAGIHRATRGGLELYVPDLPARLRKEALRGKVREAFDISETHFDARIDRRLRSTLD